jgi:hypothetical protein
VSLNKISYKLPPALAEGVKSSLADWKTNNKVARLWQKDPTLWTGTDEGKWLGWLTIVDEQLKELPNLKKLAAEIKKAKFRHALLLGMGGSSLCVEVLRLTFGKFPGYPELHVLDSTDPAQVKAIEKKLDLKKTLWSPTSSSSISTSASVRRSAIKKLAAISSPLPIQAPRWSRSRRTATSATSFPVFPALAAVIPRSRISAPFLAPSWASTFRNS